MDLERVIVFCFLSFDVLIRLNKHLETNKTKSTLTLLVDFIAARLLVAPCFCLRPLSLVPFIVEEEKQYNKSLDYIGQRELGHDVFVNLR
jgi:hypothetical protein